MSNTKFSIAIPAYKADFLTECIHSILSQTYTNFELIIINDCSPAPIEEIVKTFNDNRIKYFRNEVNIGGENLVKNWNICLGKAIGEFIIIMGDDDTLEKEYLAEFVALIVKYPDLDVYHCRSKIINDRSIPFKLTPSWPEYEHVYDNIWHRLSGLRLQYISDFVYRTESLRLNGGFFYLPLAWGSDDITAFIACANKGIAHTNKVIFNYRESRFTISSTGEIKLKLKAVLEYEEWINKFINQMEHSDYANYSKILTSISLVEFKRRRRNLLIQDLEKNGMRGVLNFDQKRARYKFSRKEMFLVILKAYSKMSVIFLAGLLFKSSRLQTVSE